MTDTSTAPAAQASRSPAPLTGARRASLQVFRVLAMITLAAIAAQFVLAGLGAFGASFDPHRMLGSIIGLLTLVLLIPMLIARPGWVSVALAVLLAILATAVQPLLAGLGDDTDAWFGGVHALNGLVIMGLTGRLTTAAGQSLRRTDEDGR